MTRWHRLVLTLGVFCGYQIIYLESSARPCKFEETLKNLILRKWIQWPNILSDKYPKSDNKGVEPSPAPCSPVFPQDATKDILDGMFRLIKPHWVYFVTPKVYNVINIKISRQQSTKKTNNNNQNKENTTPETKYRPKIISNDTSKISIEDSFATSLNKFENLFYQKNFDRLTKTSPPDRQVNGISFVQSGLFIYLLLLALTTEVDSATKTEIENFLAFKGETMDKLKTIKNIISQLPTSNKTLEFRWGSLLLVKVGFPISRDFEEGAAKTLNLKIKRISGNDTPEVLSSTLNKMIEKESRGTLRNTFDEDDLAGPVCSILVTTANLRARWRSAPTVLNGTRRFYDTKHAKNSRSVNMIRINDVMKYANIAEWNTEALEISYATPGLTLLLLMSNSSSLRGLAAKMTKTNPHEITNKMSEMRISAILPLYTLRMTLLLPGTFRSMGLTRLFDNKNGTCDRLTLSHAAQRLMFWSEAGRYAYKDDGLQWDETPEREIIVNRPYLFYVRWNNMTLMNGYSESIWQTKTVYITPRDRNRSQSYGDVH